MFTAKIYTGEGICKVKVDYNRETVHPESPHRLSDSILDERVPKGWIVCCNEKGAVFIKFGRLEPPKAGKQTTAQVAPEYLSSKDVWVITPSREGTEVIWFEGWVYLPCYSEAHCQHIISLLEQGKIPKDIKPFIV